MNSETVSVYKCKDALDKEIKPLILKWLAGLFGYENYPHSFKDQWVRWSFSVNNEKISIGFDHHGTEEHRKLLSLIHPRFLGTPQYNTLKIVNEDSFYISLSDIVHIEYPNIIGHKLEQKVRHTDNDGDVFYVYYWTVFLSDGTGIAYQNQTDKMDMVKHDWHYTRYLNERAFVTFLQHHNPL